MKWRAAVLALILCPWLAVLLINVELTKPTQAMGWYSPQCCSNSDCEPIPFEAVEDTAAGWHVHYLAKSGLAVDVVVPFNKALHSQDGRFHGCANKHSFLCLYYPSNVQWNTHQ